MRNHLFRRVATESIGSVTVTRAARLAGAALSAALALVAACWVLRDLAVLGGSPAELARNWAGDPRPLLRSRAATSGLDPVLIGVYLVTALASLRSPVAASALAATGTITLAVRLPSLWATGGGNAVLLTTLLDLTLAAALLVTAAVGRRPAASVHEPLPTRPRKGAAVTAGVLLLLAGLVTAAWEVHWAGELPGQTTVDRFTGGRSVLAPLFAPAPGWLSAVLVLLALAAGAGAFTRPPYARPFGLVAGALLCGWGVMGVAVAVRYGILDRFPELYRVQQLTVLTSAFELAAGAVVLAVLAGRGERSRPPRAHALPALPPAPPSPRPPGW